MNLRHVLRRTAGFLLPLIAVAGGVGLSWYLMSTAPEQERRAPAVETVVVDTAPLEPQTRRLVVEGYGSVVPAREVALASQVEGRLVEISPALQPGGFVRAGELLARIDPSDYDLALARAEAELEQAEADLEIEEGRRLVAKREWERFGPELETLGAEAERARSRQLALREPQLRRARALVEMARNGLAEARLALERTRVEAPFDAVVLAESAEVGLYVGTGDTIVHLAGTGRFWIVASVPASRAAGIAAAESEQVEVVRDTGLGTADRRRGTLLGLLPDLEPQGRMARVLVAVDDPLARGEEPEPPPLPLGSYVRVEVPAGSLAGVYALPREALRENSRIWVRDGEGRLAFREVEVLWRSADEVLVRGELEDGDTLVTSYLSDPLPGRRLRAREEPAR